MKRTIPIPFFGMIFVLILVVLSCTMIPSGGGSKASSPTAKPVQPSNTVAQPQPNSTIEEEPTATSEAPSWPELKYMPPIVFESLRNDNRGDIFIMNGDGSNPGFLAGTPDSTDSDPSWSPDGTSIAFISSTPEGTFDIQRINPDGSGLANLTNTVADESFYDWSPDSAQIVFSSDRSGNYDLYVMDADGLNVRQLTNTPDEDELSPDWSPNGSRIAYLCAPVMSPQSDICLINVDGSGQANLMNNDEAEGMMAWSPDGSLLAYTAPLWPSDIWVMKPDGSAKQNLTDNPADDVVFAWSPDGSKIAFSSDRGGDKKEIFVMNADGSDVIQLTHTGRQNGGPVWSPDGTTIAFVSVKYSGEFDEEIFVVRIDGSGLTNLTSNSSKDNRPSWKPLAGGV